MIVTLAGTNTFSLSAELKRLVAEFVYNRHNSWLAGGKYDLCKQLLKGYLALVPETIAELKAAGVDAPVVVGGIIPDADRVALEAMGVAHVYTPKDFRMADITADIAELARVHRERNPQAGATSGR